MNVRSDDPSSSSNDGNHQPASPISDTTTTTPRRKGLFQFRTPTSEGRRKKISIMSPSPSTSSRTARRLFNTSADFHSDPITTTITNIGSMSGNGYQSSPLKKASQKLLTPRKSVWTVPKAPELILDAPQIINDFYLNILDWSPTNLLAVALHSSVYIWDPETKHTRLLCTVENNTWVTSLKWMQKCNTLAIGTKPGTLEIWDVGTGRRVRTMTGHRKRVACMSWFDNVLSSGSRDKTIGHRDVRLTKPLVCQYKDSGVQEVSVIRVELTEIIFLLASGSNDNLVKIWDRRFHAKRSTTNTSSAHNLRSTFSMAGSSSSSSSSSSSGGGGGSGMGQQVVVSELTSSLYRFNDHKAAVKGPSLVTSSTWIISNWWRSN